MSSIDGDHVVAFFFLFFFFDNWYFSTSHAINLFHSLKGIREIEWWLNRWDLKKKKIYIYIYIYFWQIVGWHANKQNLDDVLQAMLFFWESLSKLKMVSTVFNYKCLVWESCKMLRVSWASQYSSKQWANKSTKRI